MTNGSILIVGAGPSGLALACGLGRQGVTARIIDSATGPAENSRALAVQARTLETFDLWGIGDEAAKRGLPLHGLRLYGDDKALLFHLHFAELPSRYPYTLSLPQSETEKILTAKAQQFGFDVERETRLTGIRFDSDCCNVTLERASGEQEEAQFEWVVGCDGAHSTVRTITDGGFLGKDYPQQFLLADLRIDWPFAPNEAHLFTAPDGFLGVFPMPGGCYRIVAGKQKDGSTATPDIEEVRRCIASRGPAELKVDDMEWSANFFIHARLVESMQRGRTFLVGDSAHIHSPALGQGMNTGIQDAANLAWKLALVAKGIAGSELLESYCAERWPVEQDVLARTDFTTRMMGGGLNRFYTWLRDHIGPIVMSRQKVSTQVRELVSELSVRYAESPIVLSRDSDAQLKAGDRVPDAILEVDGTENRLYEHIRGPGHHLILMGDQDVDLHGADLLDGEVTVHRFRQKPKQGEPFVNGLGANAAGYDWNSAYLVRPDGYFGFVSDIDGLRGALGEYTRKIHAMPRVMRVDASVM